ncbi:hypothetical protein KR018_011236, partial [Drosophila ironensis]
WRDGYEGHGTIHEQLGQAHWPHPELSPYYSDIKYSKETSHSSVLSLIYKIMHSLFNILLPENIPPGYVTIGDGSNLHLGFKYERNLWTDILEEYSVLLIVIAFLVACIISIPFVAVCYCCLCCCRRCKQGCPPCTASKDFTRRCCCGIIMILLILGLIFGLLIAITANKNLDRGFDEATAEIKRGTEDTCRFLDDATSHVYHLMVNNYEELRTHLNQIVEDGSQHIFLDLSDTSQSNALSSLNKLLESLDKKKKYMKNLEKLEEKFRFINSQLRDAQRGLKRDLVYGLTYLDSNITGKKWIGVNKIADLGSSRCFHLDEVPVTSYFVKAMEKIVKDEVYKIPLNGIKKLDNISSLIKKQMTTISPHLATSINGARALFLEKALNIRNVIDAVISDIHLNSLRTARTYDDVYERFGPDRRIISYIIFVLIFIIIVCLIIALLCGCIGASRVLPGPTGFCSKSFGASFLLIAIILIFCVFSLVTLLGLFYLILGVVTYEGACTNTVKEKDFFSQSYRSKSDDNQLQMVNRIDACPANEHLFTMFKNNQLYNIDDLLDITIFDSEQLLAGIPETDLTSIEIFTDEEKLKIEELLKSNLSHFSKKPYLVNICSDSGKNLKTLSTSIEKAIILPWKRVFYKRDVPGAWFYWDYDWDKVHNWATVQRTSKDAYAYAKITDEWKSTYKAFLTAIKDADKAYLDNGRSFNETVKGLYDSILASEKFFKSKGSTFIKSLTQNLTIELNEMIDSYIHYVVQNAKENVAPCYPLAYIYYRGVTYICQRLVDPINAFWLGLLLCALFLLLILFVAHRLMCIYLKIYP